MVLGLDLLYACFVQAQEIPAVVLQNSAFQIIQVIQIIFNK